MKLRNKKTGEIAYIEIEFPIVKDNEVIGAYLVGNLKELNEKWEDYEPKEPLIKDEKIRKAVRAWAEANDFAQVLYAYDYSNDVAVFMVGETKMIIEADELLDDIASYTIAELCGEEEE